ncbi:MAG: zinc ribbon domain-containing protein [Candidatus Helarchaeota archaeon]|nr:zinc ribbon domain-containing protein [Candidatus Helarchaeota archaeon]
MGRALRTLKMGPSGGERTAKFFIGVPVFKLNVQPIYLFPNGSTSLVIALIPNSGFSFKLFAHYQSFYTFVKALYYHLKIDPAFASSHIETPEASRMSPSGFEKVCPVCQATNRADTIFCDQCGAALPK